MKNVNLNVSGIKCDNTECSYKNRSVALDDYSKWLNRPCPYCSSNLLTIEDFNAIELLLDIVNECNKLVYSNDISEPIIEVKFNMNGSGELFVNNLCLENY